jgi:CubicO group peptidase (beta-lactamase class C family)
MKRILKISIPVIIIILIYSSYYVYNYVCIGSAYLAKYVCSEVFVSGRSDEQAIANAVLRMDIFNIYDIEINHEIETVSASLYGMAEKTAVYRNGLGATLLYDLEPSDLHRQSMGWNPPAISNQQNQTWNSGIDKDGQYLNVEFDSLALERVLNKAFSEPAEDDYPRNTYAVVVAYRGRIIAERYANGVTDNTPLLGWSMTKSVTNALVGILVGEGIIDISMHPPIPEWEKDNQKGMITWNHLLQMSSGLDSDEDYGDPFSSILQMLYNSYDMGKRASAQPMIAKPGKRWYYSSGTTNIISKCMKTLFKNDLASYWNFPYKKLFNKIGMERVVFEVDESGSFVGSSYMFASARDWARFGLLYLHDGVWNGEQILPAGWVSYSVEPVEHASRGRYGAHFWLNAGEKNNPQIRWYPKLPTDLFAARGHDGQYLTIIPSLDLVVVRLGNTPFHQGWNQTEFLKGIIKAVDQDN